MKYTHGIVPGIAIAIICTAILIPIVRQASGRSGERLQAAAVTSSNPAGCTPRQ